MLIWCERNSDNIKTLIESRSSDYRFIGLSLSEAKLNEYMESHPLNLPVYKKLSDQTKRTLGLGGTPQTLVISSEGKIVKNWGGAYSENLQKEIEVFFGVKLPGLPNKDETPNSPQSCP